MAIIQSGRSKRGFAVIYRRGRVPSAPGLRRWRGFCRSGGSPSAPASSRAGGSGGRFATRLSSRSGSPSATPCLRRDFFCLFFFLRLLLLRLLLFCIRLLFFCFFV